jgi:hypothetical protein
MAAPSAEELRREFLLDPEVAWAARLVYERDARGLAPDSIIAQMAAVRLPLPSPDLSERLFTHHRVEIPLDPGNTLLRLSVADYTTHDEIDRLLAALGRELDAEHGQRDE